MAKLDVLPAATGSREFRSAFSALLVSLKDDDKPQIDKFKELARELEADEDADRFETTVKRIVKKPPNQTDRPSD